MNVVAIIPARGGSKGIPGKNLRTVGGRSLVQRAVESARSVAQIDRVIVTTDDTDIAATAIAAGAEVVDRPSHLSGDRASSESALLHALELLRPTPDVVVFIQPTSPFIDTDSLADAIRRVSERTEDVVFSAVETFAFLWQIDGQQTDGQQAIGVNHNSASRPRRQDRTPQFEETGAFYVMWVSGFQRSRHRFFGRIGLAIVDDRTSIEIDTVEQLQVANALAVAFDLPSPRPTAIRPTTDRPTAPRLERT